MSATLSMEWSAAELSYDTAVDVYPMLALAEQPAVISIAETAQDELTRRRAARFIGSCIATHEVSAEYIAESPINSLHEAVQLAATGNERARTIVQTNVATDMSERTLKSGHITAVELTVDSHGIIHQDGHSLESIQANNLLFGTNCEQMQERSNIEVNNTFRLTQAYRTGNLEDYSFLVISRAADNMSHEQMSDIGFFTDTMSASMQLVTKKDGKLLMETAFVAGAATPGAERHDAQTIAVFGERLGVDLQGASAAETLDTPLLIPNGMIPNGVIDLVELYDTSADQPVFFGEAKPQQDYAQYRQKCTEKEAQFAPLVEKVTNQLIIEAPRITGPVQASQRLSTLSAKAMVQQAAIDHDINPQVFGTTAAHNIMQARIYFEQGEVERAIMFTRQAERTEISRSCPSGGGTAGADGFTGPESDASGGSSKEADSGDCEFVSKQCPKCHAKNVLTIVSKGWIKGKCGCSTKLK